MRQGQAPVEIFSFDYGAISAYAWNKDRSQIALSQNSNEVHIYTWTKDQWQKTHSLLAHDLPVTGIDWAPETNRIVTCSQDKNAFVWTFDGTKWNPDLVLVRLSRAATCVKWSPSETKFAVGSGSKLVSVCFYEKENNWWISTQIKKSIRSTVNSIDWHPNNVLLAVGSCDFKTRIFSAYVKEVDGDKPGPNPWVAKVPAFGNVVCEFCEGGGWIHCVKFSPSGNRLCWVRHDSSIAVVDATSRENVTTLKTLLLPFLTLVWVSESQIVAAGHDCCPFLFAFDAPNQLKLLGKLDVPSAEKSNKFSAMSMFRDLDKKAENTAAKGLKTLHQNSISQLAVYSSNRGEVTMFSSSGLDGLLVLWSLKKLEAF